MTPLAGTPDCSAGVSGVFSSPLSASNSWQEITGTALVPAGVRSISVRLVLFKPYGQSAAEALFDDVIVSLR